MSRNQVLVVTLGLMALHFNLPSFAQEDMSRAAWKARPYPPLPDEVTRKQVVIWSDGTRMAGPLPGRYRVRPSHKWEGEFKKRNFKTHASGYQKC